MRIIKVLLGLVILGLFTMFATANTHTIPLNFLFENQSLIGYTAIQSGPSSETQVTPVTTPRKIPVFLLVYSTFLIGFLSSSILTLGIHRSIRRKLKITQKQLAERDMELMNFKQIDHPLDSSIDPANGILPIQPS